MRTRAPDFAVMPPHRPFLSTTSTLCIPARVRWNARLAPITPAPRMIASAVCGIAALLPQSPAKLARAMSYTLYSIRPYEIRTQAPLPLRRGRARVGVESLAACRMRSPPHPNLPPRRGEGAWSIARERCLNVVWPDSAPRNVGHMRQFRQDKLLHSQPHRCTRAGHRDNHRAARHARRGPAHHRRRPDLGIAQRAKKLAKARQFFLKATLHDFIGAIARGKTCATAQQDSIGVLYLNEVRQQTPDILRLVLDDAIGTDRMTRLGERLLHVLPTRVVVRRAGVAHSDDGTPDTAGSLLSVLLVTHNACPSA